MTRFFALLRQRVRRDGVQVALAQVERDEHGGVDASVHVERRRLLGVEEDGAQALRDLSARA